eukprot:GSChrysophyteH1.ASY1.ANO1.3105.1 assembled CDS
MRFNQNFHRLKALRLFSTSANVEVTRKSIPITVISGFLGAGKTTFLQQVLNSSATGSDSNGAKTGKSFGLLVNDVASLNVDAKLLKKQSNVDTLELEDGCICCTLADDMLSSLTRLLELSEKRKSTHDHIVLECSGIAEPRNIRDIFHDAALEQYPPGLWGAVHLDTFITVIDATVFLKHFVQSSGEEKGDQAFYPDQTRRVTELLLEQVDCADVILVNKCDLLSAKESQLVMQMIDSINSTARVFSCVRGSLVYDDDTKLQQRCTSTDLLGCMQGSGIANDGFVEEHKKGKRFGITSFVYQRRRPFHPHRFTNTNTEKNVAWNSVIRSKGFTWVATSAAAVYYLSHAGQYLEIAVLGKWWDEIMPHIKRYEFGDRRQELVFIGVFEGTDYRELLEQQLDDCLLNDSELQKYRESIAEGIPTHKAFME